MMTEEQALNLLLVTQDLLTEVTAANDLLRYIYMAQLVISGVAIGCTIILLLAVMFRD